MDIYANPFEPGVLVDDYLEGWCDLGFGATPSRLGSPNRLIGDLFFGALFNAWNGAGSTVRDAIRQTLSGQTLSKTS